MKNNNYLSNKHKDLFKARANTKARVLITYIKEYKIVSNNVVKSKNRIDKIKTKLEKTDYKRKRLMQQNFSSASHLKKTHKKYWENYNSLISKLKTHQENLIQNKRHLQELKLKVPQLLNQVTNMIKTTK